MRDVQYGRSMPWLILAFLVAIGLMLARRLTARMIGGGIVGIVAGVVVSIVSFAAIGAAPCMDRPLGIAGIEWSSCAPMPFAFTLAYGTWYLVLKPVLLSDEWTRPGAWHGFANLMRLTLALALWYLPSMIVVTLMVMDIAGVVALRGTGKGSENHKKR